MNIANPSSKSKTTIPKIHEYVIHFLVDVDVLKRLDKFTIKVKKLITAVVIPIINMNILKDYVHTGGKNRAGHTRFPGEFVYRWPQTNLIAKVTNTITRAIAVSIIEK